jgi:hypothetical protein
MVLAAFPHVPERKRDIFGAKLKKKHSRTTPQRQLIVFNMLLFHDE